MNAWSFHTALDHAESIKKKKKMPHLSVVTCVLPGFPDTCPFSCVSCPGSKTVTKKTSFS